MMKKGGKIFFEFLESFCICVGENFPVLTRYNTATITPQSWRQAVPKCGPARLWSHYSLLRGCEQRVISTECMWGPYRVT